MSFHSGPPVLHYHGKRCKIVTYDRDLRAAPAFNAVRESISSTTNGSGGISNDTEGADGEEEEEAKEVVIDAVDIWVTSEYVCLL